jgi:hypothetical protein
MSILTNVEGGKKIYIEYQKEKKVLRKNNFSKGLSLEEVAVTDYNHREIPFDDYVDQVLLPYKLSQEGPRMAMGDLNSDNIDDLFIGGAAGQAGQVLFGDSDGSWAMTTQPLLSKYRLGEDQGAVIRDMDNDGDQDLVVVSGSNEFKEGHVNLTDRIYYNDGRGIFENSEPLEMDQGNINASVSISGDFNGDGDPDLFIGGRLVSGRYPIPANSALFINQQGRMVDQTTQKAPFLRAFGLVTDGVATDVDGDGDTDLLLVGEWMKPTFLINDGSGQFEEISIDAAGRGIWWSVHSADIDGDGDDDYLIGNLGWNNKFGGRKSPKLEVVAGDLDNNGNHDVVLAKRNETGVFPVRGRECSSEEMPFILQKFQSFDAYGRASLNDILTDEVMAMAYHAEIDRFESILLLNDGDGKCEVRKLPKALQTGVVRCFEVLDYDGDGINDIIAAGNHYPVEVETARYDAMPLTVCLGNENIEFNCKPVFVDNKLVTGDVRDMLITTDGKGTKSLIIAFNNGQLRAFRLPKSVPGTQ